MTEQLIYTQPESADFAAAVASAQATFKFLWREISWERRRIVPGLDMAAVKVSFAVDINDPSTPSVENMWVTDIDFDGQNLHGVLMNEPQWVGSLRAGDPVTVPVADLNDWIYVTCGRVYGGFTIDALRAGMGAAERDEHDQAWGLDFGEVGRIALVAQDPPVLLGRNLDSPADQAALATLERSEHPMSVNALDKIKEGLRQDPKLVNDFDDDGWTLLHREVLAGNFEFVRALAKQGADIKAPNRNGHTPLMLARMAGWPRLIDALQEGFPLWPIGLALVLAALGWLYFLVWQPLQSFWGGQRGVSIDGPMPFVGAVLLLGMGLVSCTGPWYFHLRERTPLLGKSRALDLGAMLLGLLLAFVLHDQLQAYVRGF
ncbi:DUF2314 domain-containing protein [Pseudomonas sp. 3A(2025)]